MVVMPIAQETLEQLPVPLPLADVATILQEAALGLQAAHAYGFIHRDIKPSNILRLNDAGGNRWVVADWGIVRRTDAATTAQHTQQGTLLGTEGFAPPEAYVNAHAAGVTWDCYSLGRIAAWAITGTRPTPLVDLAAPEPLRRFVRLLTDADPRRRPQSVEAVLDLLTHATTALPVVAGVSLEMLKAAEQGDATATIAVLRAALDHEDDEELFIDGVAEAVGVGVDEFVRHEPSSAARLLRQMDFHLTHAGWYRRSFDHYNVPLYWMQRVAEAAASANHLDLLEDSSAALFRQDARLDRWAQKQRSQEWLASLTGEAAARVARVLREQPDAIRYYGPLKNAADPSIRAVLAAKR